MFVFCDNCKNYYDDASQSEECAGIGGSAGLNSRGVSSAHEEIHSRPIDSHIHMTRLANRGGSANAPRIGHEPRIPLAAVPTADAGPSDG